MGLLHFGVLVSQILVDFHKQIMALRGLIIQGLSYDWGRLGGPVEPVPGEPKFKDLHAAAISGFFM